MKVVYLGHAAQLSGAELGLVRLLSSTTELEAHVLLAEDGPLVPALRETGASVEVIPLAEAVRGTRRAELANPARSLLANGAELLAYARVLRRRLAAIGPDLVHTNSLKAGVYGTLAARLARLPVIWHLHDRLAADYLPAAVVGPMRALISSAPSCVLAPSASTMATAGRFHRPGQRRAVIPFPVPLADARVRIRPRVERVGIVGRLTPWKGQDVFLRAFAAAFPDGPVRAAVIGSALFGESDYAEGLHALARELGVEQRVDWVGFSDDVQSQLLELDVLVSASVLPETLGQVIVEGLGVGLPVIAPAAGAPTEYLRDGHTALLHAPGDVRSLAAALRRIAGDQPLRSALGDRGPAVARRFAPDALAPRMLDLYAEVAGGSAGA